ncbi:hypothetical protein G6F68_019753 [Rhizopus microsporus]|nr:hypothetical protein G6F68_019753 [Rhizopus microsporus]
MQEIEDDPLSLGRGQRARDSVRYDDGLTEEQWLNALEDDNVDLDELIAKKERRRMKRLGRLSSEMDSDEGSRRPGRRRKEDVEDFAGI